MLKTLDTFDFKAQPGINRTLIVDLMRGEYIERHENILFVGNPGTGKTHLATALGHAACAQGKRVRFLSVTGLVTQLLEARQDHQLEGLLKRFEKLHLLVLDELGYVPFSKAGAELLFEVVSRAYERQSLILTTNCPSNNGPKSSATNDSPAHYSTASPTACTSSKPTAKATDSKTPRKEQREKTLKHKTGKNQKTHPPLGEGQ